MQIEFGQQATDALNAVNGESFIFQNAADMCKCNFAVTLKLIQSQNLCHIITDTSSGGCADYLTALGSRFVYTPELRAGPGSIFVLPEEEILPSGQEVWAAWETMLDYLLEEAGRK